MSWGRGDLRQRGFQETNIVQIVKPITKYAVMIENAENIRYYLEKSIYIAMSGRKGPVLLDIPMNIQRANVLENTLLSFFSSKEFYDNKNIKNLLYKKELEKTNHVVNMIENSNRPVILIEGGIRLSNSVLELKRLIEILKIPIVSSMMGRDGFIGDDSLYFGFIGTYGNRYANFALANSDLIIVLGSRLTSRQTGTDVSKFATEAKIIHVDIDINELEKFSNRSLSINCNLKLFLENIIVRLSQNNINKSFSNWLETLKSWKIRYPSYPTQKTADNIDPNEFINYISEIILDKSVICLDVGQNPVWVNQSFKKKTNQRILNSGGMGAIGFALPSAIGAYYENNNFQIIAICGDGGIQVNIQELQTISRENIPIKIFILNNRTLGMIRHFQEMYFDSNYYGTLIGYSSLDFSKIAYAYNTEYFKIESIDNISSIKSNIYKEKPIIFDVILNNITYVYPKLAIGKPIEDQEPLLNREEFENIMSLKYQ